MGEQGANNPHSVSKTNHDSDVEKGLVSNTQSATDRHLSTDGMASAGSRSGSAFQAAADEPGTHFQEISLAFTNITYKITVGRGKHATEKTILNDMSGYVKPGTFVAIMGPTGSGKTSLLNVLGGRVMRAAKSTLEGQVLVNGRPRDESFRRISAYVMQDDVLFSALTVWETVTTAALLRLPSSMPASRRIELAETVIRELGLSKARDTPIGNEMIRGVSGGERKRTNIAVEMLSNPSLVFLDEPTSGLDSFQALNVMSTMSDLASAGRTVISTIHQPRSSIFALFETLLLLSEGKLVYFGKATEAINYFSALGFTCPSHFNPADYFMDITSPDKRDEERERDSSTRIQLLTNSFSPSAEVRVDLHQKSMEEQAEEGMAKFAKYASTWTTQIAVLMRRSWWQATRDRVPLIIAYVQALVMMVMISILYSEVDRTQKGIQNLQGAIFFISIFLAFNGVFQMITTFPMERGIVNRERSSNSYRVSAYYPAKVLSEWPLRAAPTVVFILISYWPVGFQRSADKFFLFLLCGVLEFTAMNAAGIMISSIAPTPQIALALGPLTTVIFMLFGGFYVNLSSIPVWIRWVRYISPIQWGFVGLCVNEFSGLKFKCAGSGSCTRTGEQVLELLSISEYSVGQAILYQCFVICGLHILAFLALQANGPKLQPLSKIGGVYPHGKGKKLEPL